MAKGRALEQLVFRTLNGSNPSERRVKRKKIFTKAEKKLRRKHRDEIKKQRGSLACAAKPLETKRLPRTESTEIENLRAEISKALKTTETYVKRQSKSAEQSWEGLTPGLAPLGYDPDESDSDDNPY